jgi:hypothetical protein
MTIFIFIIVDLIWFNNLIQNVMTEFLFFELINMNAYDDTQSTHIFSRIFFDLLGVTQTLNVTKC